MKRSHWVAAGVLVIAGILVSLMVIPRSRDLAAMRLREGDIRGAGREYEGRVAAGDLSPGVVGGLLRTYREGRKHDRAAALLEKYVAKHPDDREALRELARSYQASKQTGRYLQTLERLNRDAPAEEDLRELSRGYSQTGDAVRQKATLERLARMGRARAQDYLDLSHVAEKAGQKEAAAGALGELVRRWPGGLDEAGAVRAVGLWLDAGRAEDALRLARAWLGEHPEPGRAARLAAAFRHKGAPRAGAKLVEAWAGKPGAPPELVGELALAEAAQGSRERAFERLEKLRRSGRLDGAALEAYLDLALALGRKESAFRAAAAYASRLGELPGWLAANLAEAAGEAGHIDVARVAARAAGGEMDRRPAAAAMLALGRGDRSGAERIAGRAAGRAGLAPAERVRLAGVYRRMGRPGEALRQMETAVAGLPAPAAGATLELARLYVETGRAAEGWRRFEALAAARRSPDVEAGRALVGVAAGHPEAALAWLRSEQARRGEPELLRDLAQSALDHKQPQLAVAAARALGARRGGQGDTALLAEALLAAGRPAEALAEARKLGRNALYERALFAAAASGGEAREELGTHATRTLASAGLPEERLEALLAALVAAGAGNRALAALAEQARRKGGTWLPAYVEAAVRGGGRKEAVALLASELDRKDLPDTERETRLALLVHHGTPAETVGRLRQFAPRSARWAAAYENALEKSGRTDELAAWLRLRLGDPRTSPEDRRRIGFGLLEAGDRPGAETAFWGLARAADPASPDVKQLLHLWGPRPPAPALGWLESRVAAASGDQRAGWIEHLVSAGAAGRAVRIGPGTGSRSGKLTDAWLRALQAAGDGAALERAVLDCLNSEADPARVLKLARLAVTEGRPAAAQKAYERLLELRPGDTDAARELGKAAYASGRFDVARRELGRAAAAGTADAEAHFYLAELLGSERRTGEARREYERALEAVGGAPEKTYRLRKLEANLLFRLGRRAESRRRYEALLEERPEDRHLKADYTATLVEGNDYGRAERILAER